MAPLQQRTEIRDGMRIDWDVPITMDDVLVLRADVFRPLKDGKFPVILSYISVHSVQFRHNECMSSGRRLWRSMRSVQFSGRENGIGARFVLDALYFLF